MSTALDIITAALRRINSYQPGETISNPDTDDCLEALNDLLDSWSTDKLQIYGTNEYILQWTASGTTVAVNSAVILTVSQFPVGIVFP